MAKNKNRPQPSAFDKFKVGEPKAAVLDDDTGKRFLEVEEDDEAEIAEPTDAVEVTPQTEEDDDTGEFTPPPVIRPGVPGGAYNPLDMEVAKATTVAEQEAIIASHHPNIRDTMEDPAVHYKRALSSGRQVPVLTIKPGTDPLLVEAKDMIERLVSGGLIVPGVARNHAVDLLLRIVDTIMEKPNGTGS